MSSTDKSFILPVGGMFFIPSVLLFCWFWSFVSLVRFVISTNVYIFIFNYAYAHDVMYKINTFLPK